MEKHSSILQRASEIETSDPNYNLALLQVIMKAADLSNELRSPTVAYSWIHRMYDELNSQMRDEGLPTLPTDPLFIAKDQIQFINTKILPIYKQLNLMANNGAQFFLQRIQKALRRHQMILDNAEKNENENSDSLGASKSKRNT
ncbi:High affinity cAMP-specific and IBMX-insensitive 3',5'-cyclic phosphodiesterase 9A [Coelomomyces lativittatus]|nr:High affinity cAMP-specific and IBMX-insensitive 3',5'-cyclic phosphodiesterase 9A [Coelomomyces lativittatus]